MKNGFKTAALLAFLGALFMVVGVALGGATGLFIGLLLGLAFCGGTYWFSDKLAIASARAKPVTREEDPELYAMVDDLAQRAEIPMPRVYVSPDNSPTRSPRAATLNTRWCA
jgi:heat shock protein HtpX